MFFERKFDINGQKMSETRLNNIVNTGTDNVVFSGFTTVDELRHLVYTNGRHSEFIMIKILNKLLNLYSEQIIQETNKLLTDPASASNVAIIGNRANIICNLLIEISNDHVTNKKKARRKNQVEVTEEADDSYESDVIYTDVDNTEDEETIEEKNERINQISSLINNLVN